MPSAAPRAVPPSGRGLLEAVLQAVPAGVAVLRGPEFVLELVNPAFEALAPALPMLGLRLDEVFPEAARALLPLLRRVLEEGEPYRAADQPLALRRAPGAPLEEASFTLELRRLAGAPGEADAVLATVVETTGAVRARRGAEEAARAHRQSADRLARLQRATMALAGRLPAGEVARRALDAAVEALGAATGAVCWQTAGDEVELVAQRGYDAEVAGRWRRFRADALPVGAALRERRAIWIASPEELARRFPAARALPETRHHGAWAVVPLVTGRGAAGALALAFDAPRGFDAEDRALLQSFGHACAQALDRARADDRVTSVLAADPGGLAILAGPEARVALANGAFAASAGVAGEDVTGRSPQELWPDDDGLRLRALVERAARGEVARGERFERHGPGGLHGVLAHARPLVEHGEVLLALWDTTELDAARRAAERARERAELLAAMAAELSAGDDLPAVLRTALDRGTALVGADDGALFLMERDGRHLRGFFEVWARDRTGAVLDLDRLPHSRAAVTSLAPVLYTRPECAEDEVSWFERIGIWCALAVPLAVDGRCIGILYLNRHRDGDEPGPEDVEFSAAIATQCALAITRARGLEAERRARGRAEAAETAMRQAARRLALVADVTAALSSAPEPRDVAAAIFEKGLRAFGARAAVLHAPDGEAAVLEHELGEAVDRAAFRRMTRELPAPAAGALARGEPVWLESREALLALAPALADDPWVAGCGAWAAIPLVVDGRVTAVLGLAFAERRALDAEERAIVVSLAQKFAQALDRARLHAENREQVARAERARRHAEALAGVAADLNRGADLGAVVRTALERAVQLLGGDDGSVYLLEDGAALLRGVAEIRPLGRPGLELRVADLPHARDALAARAPCYWAAADAAGAERAWAQRHGIRAFFALPMVEGERRLGVVFVNRHHDAAPPAADELAFGAAIASHCALALGRAQAYEAERAARARAEAAEAVTRRIAQRLAVSQELTAALSSAHGPDEVAAAIFAHGLPAVGARAGAIFVREGDGLLRALAFHGYPEEALAAWREPIPLASEGPAAQAVRTGQAVHVHDLDDAARRWPRLAASARALGDASRISLPLLVDGDAIGVLDLGFAGTPAFDLEDRAFLAWIAQKCAQAIERARLYEAERAARAEAERVGKLQEQLLAVVGHDLRTPLSAISMGATVLFRRGGLDERQAQTLGRMASSAERMTGIIRDLLDFSRARQGSGIPISREPIDLAEVVGRAVLELQGAHPEREILLDAPGPCPAVGDEPRLLQVVSNLVGNAVQHGDPDAPIRVRLRADADGLVLEVHNAGAPIPDALLPALFEPFKRGERRGDGETSSIGLGLFIVREVVRAHGGAVDVRSAAGEGTTFRVRLPRE